MDRHQVELPRLGKNQLLLPRISPDLALLEANTPLGPRVLPFQRTHPSQGALSTQQGSTGRSELDSGPMLLPGPQFPGLKQDFSHSSAFICVI